MRDVGSERSTELTCGVTGSGLRGVNLCHRIRREIELKSVAVTPKRFVTSDSTIRSGIPSQTRVDDRWATDPEKASTALSSILPSWSISPTRLQARPVCPLTICAGHLRRSMPG